jgi:hypothetical protein
VATLPLELIRKAKPIVVLNWLPVIWHGTPHLLNHLNAFKRELIIAANGRAPERRISLAITFGLHCFSRAIRPEDAVLSDVVSDGREKRVFDAERYRCSLELPSILQSLEMRRCFHTAIATSSPSRCYVIKGKRWTMWCTFAAGAPNRARMATCEFMWKARTSAPTNLRSTRKAFVSASLPPTRLPVAKFTNPETRTPRGYRGAELMPGALGYFTQG